MSETLPPPEPVTDDGQVQLNPEDVLKVLQEMDPKLYTIAVQRLHIEKLQERLANPTS